MDSSFSPAFFTLIQPTWVFQLPAFIKLSAPELLSFVGVPGQQRGAMRNAGKKLDFSFQSGKIGRFRFYFVSDSDAQRKPWKRPS